MFKQVLAATALAALAACGGGGGGGSSLAPVATQSSEPIQAAQAPADPVKAPVKTPVVTRTAPQPFNPGCVIADDGNVACDLIADSRPIGVGVAAGTYVTFTNRTGSYLQINSASAYTGEQEHWSEYCAFLNKAQTGQVAPGTGEVACITKNVGEDYAALTWGGNTGLSIAPGDVLYLGSHTEPKAVSHTYSLMVSAQTTGLSAWRQPQQDLVFVCNGLPQSTAWTPWKNTTGATLHVAGASIYAVSGTATPNELAGQACLYVLNADGSVRLRQCDDALRTRGATSFAGIDVAPGESVAAQAMNTCNGPANWDWVAYLHVW